MRINSGFILGSLEIYGANNQRMYTWKGIPYAQPPLGNMRYRAPVPVKSWSNIKKTTQYGSVCPQTRPGQTEVSGKEDCLFINVFTPYRIQSRLPVVFRY